MAKPCHNENSLQKPNPAACDDQARSKSRRPSSHLNGLTYSIAALHTFIQRDCRLALIMAIAFPLISSRNRSMSEPARAAPYLTDKPSRTFSRSLRQASMALSAMDSEETSAGSSSGMLRPTHCPHAPNGSDTVDEFRTALT